MRGRPRATGDLDVWVEPSPGNAARVMEALAASGAPIGDVSEADFAAPGIVYQVGVPPGRIDILTALTGISFGEAWPPRVLQPQGAQMVALLTVSGPSGTLGIRPRAVREPAGHPQPEALSRPGNRVCFSP